jgi:hypothetical protein
MTSASLLIEVLALCFKNKNKQTEADRCVKGLPGYPLADGGDLGSRGGRRGRAPPGGGSRIAYNIRCAPASPPPPPVSPAAPLPPIRRAAARNGAPHPRGPTDQTAWKVRASNRLESSSLVQRTAPARSTGGDRPSPSGTDTNRVALLATGRLTPSLQGLFWGAPGGGRAGVYVWGCKECESTKSHAVKAVRLCEK